MKIIECTPESIDRMYCPSTDEIIFAPGMEELADNADALIGYWHHEFINEPIINNDALKTAWNEYFSKHLSEGYEWDDLRNFFREYENPGWITYECDFIGMACGPVTTTILFVVKADTVIEEDTDFEENLDEMTNEEIEEEILGRQLRSLLG